MSHKDHEEREERDEEKYSDDTEAAPGSGPGAPRSDEEGSAIEPGTGPGAPHN
jgi:hypothetical protein